ncbi:MAG: hypothetical protein IPL23_05620 [Saprospiraceae bacterium]|nr:hypothetical protein [Saprospiraceae bacterium]
MLQIPGLFIMETPNRGKGVFAGLPISEGDSIEVCHIVKIAKAEIPIIHKTRLHDYYFYGVKIWKKQHSHLVLVPCTTTSYSQTPTFSLILRMKR